MHELESKFGHWVLKYRWPIILLCLVMVFLAARGGANLSFTTNYRVFFSADNPQLLAFDALENSYTKNDNVMFVLTPKDGNVFTRKTLTAVEELTTEAWQIPYSIRVDSLANFQHTEAEADDLVVANMVEDAAQFSDEKLAKVRDIAINEPLLRNRIISPRAHVTAVNATIQLPGVNEASEVPEVVAFSRDIAEKFRAKFPEIEVRITGMVFMNNAFSEASKKDMASLVPLSFLLIIVFLAILLKDYIGNLQRFALLLAGASGIVATMMFVSPVVAGLFFAASAAMTTTIFNLVLGVALFGILLWHFPATISIFIVIMLSIAGGMGLGGHIGMPLTPPSASSPTIILTIAIANSVHVLVTYLHEMRKGLNKEEALVESMRVNLQPVFLASMTTAIGFLTMNFSEVPPFQHLGNFVAMGVAISFVLSVTFLPALMSLLPVRVNAFENGEDVKMAKLGNFIVEKRKKLIWGMGVVIIVLIAAVPRNELNDVFVHYFDKSVAFRADSDYLTENLTGLYLADYSLESGETGGISNPQFQKEVAAFADWYREQPETLHVNTFTDIMMRLNKNMHADDPAWYKVPDNRELAAQYLLLYEMSLPYGLDLNNQINVSKSATRVTVTMHTMSTNEVLAIEQRAQQWLDKNATSIKSAPASGPTIMFAHIGKRNIVSMLGGTTIALILISMILIVALRSFKIGTVSMLPNLVPAAMGFGLWGMLVGEVGLALSVVTGMTLGIVVDDTVHFLSKYLRARRERNCGSEEAVRYAFKSVGRALITTSSVLVVGFLVLAQSSFKLNADMGLLTAAVIVFALAADFLFLPPLLMKLEGEKK